MTLKEILLSLNKDPEYQEMIEKARYSDLVECWRLFCEEADKEINREIIRSMKLK